jgi:hypothetical protein
MQVHTRRGRLLEADLKKNYARTHDLSTLLGTFDELLIEHSDYLRTEAISYRGCWVGCCAVAFAREPLLLEGANNTPYYQAPRDCGEMGVDEQTYDLARMGAQDLMVKAIYLGGPDQDQIETILGRREPTLLMCNQCTDIMASSPYTHPKTPVTTTNYGVAVRRHVIQEMVDYHDVVAIPPSSLAALALAAA